MKSLGGEEILGFIAGTKCVGGSGVIRIFNRGKRIEVGEDFLVEAIVLIVVCSVIFILPLC